MRPNQIQSMLDTAGVQASRIEWLWWVMFCATGAVYAAVMIALAVAVWKGSRAQDELVERPPRDHRLHQIIGAAAALSLVILIGLLVASVGTGRAMAGQRDDQALVIQITGKQWWWDVEYQHPDPSLRVRTANELHLPAGRTVGIKLLSSDVIHSFWVPALHGKRDLVPGHGTAIWLRADTPGIYRGQCAEFCGVQHAHMALTVVVETSDDFERWIQGQRPTAPPPATPQQRHGRQIVEQTCAMCHQVRGTSATARFAPDLTHVATRSHLAAGTLPNTRDHLARWIFDPQAVKPGNRMPALGLGQDQIDAVVAYLETLR